MPQVKEKKNSQEMNLMPQNIEAEEAVLGAILVNPRVITKVVETLRPESFYKPAPDFLALSGKRRYVTNKMTENR